MIIEQELKKVFRELIQQRRVELTLGSAKMFLSIKDDNSAYLLTSLVYNGGNYIPSSVRACLNKKAPFDHHRIETHLTVDEENFQIFLNLEGPLAQFKSPYFQDLLEEFCWLADEWREYLDQHDKNDLIYVHRK